MLGLVGPGAADCRGPRLQNGGRVTVTARRANGGSDGAFALDPPQRRYWGRPLHHIELPPDCSGGSTGEAHLADLQKSEGAGPGRAASCRGVLEGPMQSADETSDGLAYRVQQN
ncbi:hypothetical protein NDU88_008016 [Pleurodeles waltl]|uniref:Uncharacterized protein n=1 Tax=Pleurodeles waltl TaxID=8319 RepID=A0AAV7PVH5_PLEWA|nr:hypothetical protein NDU88_008016 [Pleurodeles waltl]